METLKYFRQNLGQLMADQGMTTGQLAEHLGTKRPYVSRLLNGHTNPGLEMCDKIANILGVTVSELVSEKIEKISQ